MVLISILVIHMLFGGLISFLSLAFVLDQKQKFRAQKSVPVPVEIGCTKTFHCTSKGNSYWILFLLNSSEYSHRNSLSFSLRALFDQYSMSIKFFSCLDQYCNTILLTCSQENGLNDLSARNCAVVCKTLHNIGIFTNETQE